jgi:hypothetical protein
MEQEQESADPTLARHQARLDALAKMRAATQTLNENGVRVRHQLSIDPATVHIDQPLSNVSIKYKNRLAIADDVMPVVQVDKLSNVVYTYGDSMAFDTANTDAASLANGQVSQVSPSYSSFSYACKKHALGDVIPFDVEDNADNPLSPLVDSTDHINEVLRLAREIRVANKVFSASNYGSNTTALSGTDRWDDPLSDVVGDIEDAMTAMQMMANVCVIGEQVWNKIKSNVGLKSFITGRPSYKGGATPFMMDVETFAAAFGFEKVLIGRMKNNTAKEGQTASYGWVWGKSVALLHIPTSLGIRTATWGMTLRKGTFKTRSWFDQNYGGDGAHRIVVSHNDDEKVVETAGKTGYLYTTVVS